MDFLTREQVKAIVIASLKAVAGLPEDVESATFQQMNPFQRKVFLENLKENLNAKPPGNDEATYDVNLQLDTIDLWDTVEDCIDWVTENQMVVFANKA